MKKLFIFTLLLLINLSLYSKTIEFWHYWEGERESQLLILVKTFEERTGIKVNIKKVPWGAISTRYKVLSQKGGGPDLIVGPVDWIGKFFVDDLIVPIDEEITEKDKKIYLENILESCKYKGKIYGLPISYSMISLIYNKDLVKTPPRTSNELLKLAESIRNEEEEIYGFAYKMTDYFYHWTWANGFGGSPLKDNKISFDSKEHIASLKFIKKLYNGKNKDLLQEADGDLIINLFNDGYLGMIMDGPWVMREIVKSGVNFGIAKLPVINETGIRAKPLISTKLIMLSSKAKDKESSIKFLKFLSSEESQAELVKSGSTLPTAKNVYEYRSLKESPYYEAMMGFRKQVEDAIPMSSNPKLSIGIWPYGAPMLNNVLAGERSIEEIVKETQAKSLDAVKGIKE